MSAGAPVFGNAAQAAETRGSFVLVFPDRLTVRWPSVPARKVE